MTNRSAMVFPRLLANKTFIHYFCRIKKFEVLVLFDRQKV
ncbi:hypothetical protein C789_5539 [Microcystis aeruginosa FACHB-905 = DIANCHI905]|nr:hypothetical protein C789_5539 [Microcystis aeruginosa FACHB-905 = DIANCHI905]